jgi:Ser/Thr protein kinase RdoA (MazF antagonist)
MHDVFPIPDAAAPYPHASTQGGYQRTASKSQRRHLKNQVDTLLSRWPLLRRLRQDNWAKAALEQYGLRGARFTLHKEGIYQRKLAFLVESPTRGRFLLRIVRKLSSYGENLMPELLWLQALRREMPLCVPEPIYALDGSLVSHVSPPWALEDRRCVLLRWLPGKEKEKTHANPEDLSLAGSYVARLHRHCVRYGVPEGLALSYVWDWDWVFGEATPLWNKGKSVYSRSELHVFRAAAERIRQDLQELGKDSNVFGVIHRDLHLSNFLFHDGKAYAIDFETCGWGYYLFDVAVTLSSLEPHGAPVQAAFLDGYQRERPLPEGHWGYLETFIAMRLVQRINMVLRWEDPTWRRWGPKALSGTVEALKEFVAGEGKSGQIDFDSPWWRQAFGSNMNFHGYPPPTRA